MYRPLVVLVAAVGTVGAADPVVRVGTKVDDLRFKDIRYLSRSPADFGDKKAYVFAFVQSGCPLAEKYLPVLDRLDREYRDKGVQVAAVNSGPADTVTVMAAQAVEFGVAFPFLKDADCQAADALGVTRTPEVVVLDAQRASSGTAGGSTTGTGPAASGPSRPAATWSRRSTPSWRASRWPSRRPRSMAACCRGRSGPAGGRSRSPTTSPRFSARTARFATSRTRRPRSRW